jgi:hypothetical protein
MLPGCSHPAARRALRNSGIPSQLVSDNWAVTHCEAEAALRDSPQSPPSRRLVLVAVGVGLALLLPAWFLILESATNKCTADPPDQAGQWSEVQYDRSWWPLFITCVIDAGTSRERRISVPWESRPDCPLSRQTCPGY